MPWLAGVAGRYLLPMWFGIFAIYNLDWIVRSGSVGLDARIYHRAAVAWLAGGDPWAASVTIPSGPIYHFAGLPPTVLAFSPTAILPEGLVAGAWVAGSGVAAVWIIRRLTLPWWWLAFPPLVMGVLSANPGIVLLALLLAAHPVLAAIAAALKVYAVLPLISERRWRALAVTIGAGLASMLVFPSLWLDWLASSRTVAERLLAESGGGTGPRGAMVIVALLAILVIAWLQPKASGWLAIPALWPAAQFHYSIMAMPVMSLVMAVLMAPPIYGLPALAVTAHAWLLLWRRLRHLDRDLNLNRVAGRPGHRVVVLEHAVAGGVSEDHGPDHRRTR